MKTVPNTCFSTHVTASLKGIAILLMLFHHLFARSADFEKAYGVISAPLSMHHLNLISDGAAICVSMFVFLTGYGMTLALKGRSSGEMEKYAVRHCLKLELSFLVVFLASAGTFFLRADGLSVYLKDGKASAIRYFLTDALGFATYAGTPTYNETWWYISFAVFLILLMPVVSRIIAFSGLPAVLLAGFVKSFGVDAMRPFARFLLILFLGAYLADRNFFGRAAIFLSGVKKRLFFLLLTLLLSLSGYAVHLKWDLNPWANAFVVFMLVVFLFILTDLFHIRLRFLELCGKYSMNIFLIHTLLYEYYFTGIIYKPRYFLLIEAVLLAMSLALSVPLAALQKYLLRKCRLTGPSAGQILHPAGR